MDTSRPVSFFKSAILRLVTILKVVRQFQLYQAYLRIYLVVDLEKVMVSCRRPKQTLILASRFGELVLTVRVNAPRDHLQVFVVTARL